MGLDVVQTGSRACSCMGGQAREVSIYSTLGQGGGGGCSALGLASGEGGRGGARVGALAGTGVLRKRY